MVWRRTGDKQLPQPMTTQFPDAYMRHQASISSHLLRESSSFDIWLSGNSKITVKYLDISSVIMNDVIL